MDPITITLRSSKSPAASAPVGGEMSAAEIDGNFTALKAASEQLDTEKLSTSAVAPVTTPKVVVVDADTLIALNSEAGGAPVLVSKGNLLRSIHPTLRAILDGGAANFNNNARTKAVLSSPPTVTVGTSSIPAGYTQEFVFGDAGAPFTSGGGLPTTVAGVTTFPCVTADATFNGVAWRVSTEVFGDGVAFLLDSITATGYRFLVDGQYVSLSGSTSAAGAQRWYSLEFSSYGKRIVTVEGLQDTAFSRAAVKANGTLMLPNQGAPGIRIINIGDSNTAMNGETSKYDCYTSVMSDLLGIQDIWASGVTDTGFVATLGGTYNNYSERRADWAGNSPDALIFTASLNEVVQGTSTAAHKAAVTAELTYIRATLGPFVPVFIFGIVSNSDFLADNSLLTTAQAHETAVAEAVTEFGDSYVRFIPSLTAGVAFFTGTGPGTGNWDLFVNGTNHANVAGNAVAARWIANKLIEASASMAGVPVPAFAQWAPVAAAGGGGGQMSLSYVSDETNIIDGNMPAVRRFFLNSVRYATLLDLSGFTQCRLVIYKDTVAGATGSRLCLEYATSFSTSISAYADAGVTEVACACDVLNQVVSSGWIDLVAGARADVFLVVTTEGGDGVLDPAFGNVIMQFR